jgi:hypothetical protein
VAETLKERGFFWWFNEPNLPARSQETSEHVINERRRVADILNLLPEDSDNRNGYEKNLPMFTNYH